MTDRDPLPRHLDAAVRAAMADTPIVCLVGPRQVGKTTLAALVGGRHGAAIFSLDDLTVRAAAEADPAGFIGAIDGPMVIDEVQLVPGLFPAIKLAVDRRRRAGRFLLTGSANVLTLPRISESLAGRMEVLTLWPFSQGELLRHRDGFIDGVFGARLPPYSPRSSSRRDLVATLLKGGFPEIQTRGSAERRSTWFRSYLTTVLQRDVREVADVEGLTALPRLVGYLAARAGSIVNVADIGRAVGIPHTTLTRYLAILEQVFLVYRVPAWSGDRARRMLKSPRLALADVGLLSHLAGLSEDRLAAEPTLLGPLLENFATMELIKQSGWSKHAVSLCHYRTYGGREVDLVLERADGKVVGIEVKAAASVTAADLTGLTAFREAAGSRFVRGIVLYTGRAAVPFAPDLVALPIDALWRMGQA